MHSETADLFLEIDDLDLSLRVTADGGFVGMEAVLLQIRQSAFAVKTLEGEMPALAAEDTGQDFYDTTHEDGRVSPFGLHSESGKGFDDIFRLVGVLIVDAHMGEAQTLQGHYRFATDVRDRVPLLGFDQVSLDHPGAADGKDVGSLCVVGKVIQTDAPGGHELELRKRTREILQHVYTTGSFSGEELQDGKVSRKALLDIARGADAWNHRYLVLYAPIYDGWVETGGDDICGSGGDGLLRQFDIDDGSGSDKHLRIFRSDPFDGLFCRIGSERNFCTGEAALDQGAGKTLGLVRVIDLHYRDQTNLVDFLKEIFVHGTHSSLDLVLVVPVGLAIDRKFRRPPQYKWLDCHAKDSFLH